jgi:hypothetical protein
MRLCEELGDKNLRSSRIGGFEEKGNANKSNVTIAGYVV